MEEGTFVDGWWYAGSANFRTNRSMFSNFLGVHAIKGIFTWEVLYKIFQKSKMNQGIQEALPLIGVKSYRCQSCGYIENYA